jgi:peptidoglycan/LPS O-acetylase OafA/YrhL
MLAAVRTRARALFSKQSVLVILGDGSYGIYLLHVPIVVQILATSAAKGFSISGRWPLDDSEMA